MTKSPEELLAMQFGGATVAENLRRAISSGAVIENKDGTLELSRNPGSSNWMTVPNGPPLGCVFLMNFVFRNAYGRSAVPHGCRECYKVKVVPRTLRELVAAWQIAKRIECRSKWGIDLYNPHSQNIYAGYFYTTGLDAARVLFKVVRQALNADPKLGPDITMTIKRGCDPFLSLVGSINHRCPPLFGRKCGSPDAKIQAAPAIR